MGGMLALRRGEGRTCRRGHRRIASTCMHACNKLLPRVLPRVLPDVWFPQSNAPVTGMDNISSKALY